MRQMIFATALFVSLAGCSTLNPDPEETARLGQEQLERHTDNPDVGPVDIGLEVAGESASAAFANDDDSALFGDVGRTPTTFQYSFGIPEGTSDDDLLELAGAEIEARGGALTTDRPGLRIYRFESLGDELVVELRNLGTGVFKQMATISS